MADLLVVRKDDMLARQPNVAELRTELMTNCVLLYSFEGKLDLTRYFRSRCSVVLDSDCGRIGLTDTTHNVGVAPFKLLLAISIWMTMQFARVP
jgi:hypothetical protein